MKYKQACKNKYKEKDSMHRMKEDQTPTHEIIAIKMWEKNIEG